MSFSAQQCSICMNPLANFPIATIPCGHVFHFNCIHNWLINSNIQTEKNCPSCRTRAKIYDVIRLFGIFEKEDSETEREKTDVSQNNDETQQQADDKKFEELAILRTENSALKRDIKILQDESELAAQKLENDQLKEEVERLTNEVRTKNQELMNCRLTVAEFSLLLPRLEEQQRKSTAELKQAIKRYEELRRDLVKTEDKLLDEAAHHYQSQ